LRIFVYFTFNYLVIKSSHVYIIYISNPIDDDDDDHDVGITDNDYKDDIIYRYPPTGYVNLHQE